MVMPQVVLSIGFKVGERGYQRFRLKQASNYGLNLKSFEQTIHHTHHFITKPSKAKPFAVSKDWH